MFNQCTYLLHPSVKLCADFCTLAQLIGGLVNNILTEIFLVTETMLYLGPEFHGDGTKLYFNLHVPFFILKEDGNLHNKVKASVTTLFRSLYVIFNLNKSYIILIKKALCKIL